MDTLSQSTNPESAWPATLAGVALFFILGLVLLVGELPFEWGLPSWVPALRAGLFFTLLFFLPLGVCLGWIRSFPRWSIPYVFNFLLASIYMTQAATPGLNIFGYPVFGRELWGWRAFYPLLACALVALLVTRSLDPLRRFFTNIRQDWTLLTFGMSGTLPLLVLVSFDEMDHLYSLYFMLVILVLMVAMALFYLRSRSVWQRILALLLGIVPTLAIVALVPQLYWSPGRFPQRSLVAAGIFLLVICAPLLGELWRLIVRRRPAY